MHAIEENFEAKNSNLDPEGSYGNPAFRIGRAVDAAPNQQLHCIARRRRPGGGIGNQVASLQVIPILNSVSLLSFSLTISLYLSLSLFFSLRLSLYHSFSLFSSLFMQYLACIEWRRRKPGGGIGKQVVSLQVLFVKEVVTNSYSNLLNKMYLLLWHTVIPIFSLFMSSMTSIAQLIKTSEYVCTGRYPIQASAVFLNELIISLVW